MAKTLDQTIGYESLCGIINDPSGGVPEDILPSPFLKLITPTVGDTAKWTVSPNSRRAAASVNYGSPARTDTKSGIATRHAKCIHAFNNILHDVNTLTMLRQFDNPMVQTRGQQLIDAQTVTFRQKLNNLRVSSVYSAMRYGAIYLDGDGELLPSSSGAVQTIDLAVPANNKNQCNGAITASWATATTDIAGNIATIQSNARKISGLPIRHAFYGKAIPSYIAANNVYKELMKADVQLASALRAGTIPTGFGNSQIQWHPIYDAFFEDSAGTNQSWFPDDYVVFTPEPSLDWYTMVEGTYEVPTNLGGVAADAAGAVGSFATKQGMFSYAKITDNPSGIQHFMGDTFLPVFKVPSAIFIADTIA